MFINETNLTQLLDMSSNIVSSSQGIVQILISLTITFIIAMFIYWVYKKTYNGVLYSKNFNTTLVMTSIIVNALMIGISGNLVLSLGLVGALSIVRFRTAIKDPKDTAFIFWAISVGVINGVGYYSLSIAATLFLAIVLFVLSKRFTFSPSYMLILKYTGDAYDQVEKILVSDLQSYFIRTDSYKDNTTEKVIEIRIISEKKEKLLQKIRAISAVKSCVLVSSNGEFSE